MRIRLRAPGGALTITLDEDAKISDLIAHITEKTSLSSFDIKYGYPPKPLLLSQHPNATPLNELDTKLNGEQLTISAREDEPLRKQADVAQKPIQAASSPSKQTKPITLQKKEMARDTPEIPMPERHATLGITIQTLERKYILTTNSPQSNAR